MEIPLSEKEKIRLLNTDNLYSIMQPFLLREDKIDRDKEHFWVIGLTSDHRILFIELISLGSAITTLVEPMEVFSVALQKRAVHIILCHNQPNGQVKPSEAAKDLTDRLIQVGTIVNTPVFDHQIITPEKYFSFEETGLMKVLRKSTKYVPSFEMAKRIREEAAQLLQQKEEDFTQKIKSIEEQLKKEQKLREKAEYNLKQEKINTAQRMKEVGVDIALIIKVTGLSEQEIEAL